MVTSFERLDVDARDEWLDHPVTGVYLDAVRKYHAQIAQGLLEVCKGGRPGNEIHLAGGELRALEFMLNLTRRGP